MPVLTRRSFLWLLGSSAAAVVAGCTRGEGAATTAPATTGATSFPTGPGDLPWSVWEEVRTALRAGPDHLPARAAEVVRSGDPEAIFAFVRDRISLLPPSDDGFAQAVAGRRWGTRGTLRGGRGTPRERADLLVDLYRQASFEAEVVEGDLTVPVEAAALLQPRGDLRFAPPVDEATIARWHSALVIDAVDPAPDPDPDGREAAALAGLLLGVLGTQGAARPFDPTPPSRVPLVRVVVGGTERFANPLLPEAVFGESYVAAPVVALAGVPPAEVRAAISYARSVDPSQRIVLAEGRWPLEDVVGRLVVGRFVPAGDFSTLFTTPLDAITTFAAVVGIDGPDLTPAEVSGWAVVGDSVTVSGERVRASEGGVLVGEEQVGGDPGAAAAVAGLTVTVSAAAFPSVFLTVGAVDAAGNPVTDLPATAFTVEENARPVSFALTASHLPPPSVVLLFDGSASLPAEFRAEGAAVLARLLAEEVLAGHPTARFRLAGVNYGTASVSPAWLSTASEVEVEAARVIADGSELWSALAATRGVGASVIVLVTDARSTDTADQVAAARPWVHAGPPVVVVGVGDFDPAAGQDLARTSGGVSVPAADRAAAVEAVTRFLTAASASPHRIAYRAVEDGAASRRVVVRVGGVESSAEYAVPASPERLTPPGVCGLYLTVAIGSREVVRTLAGLPWEEATPTSPVSAEVLEEVRSALLGAAAVSIEAGPPPASVWLDDFLTAKLSQRPLFEAREAGVEPQVEALRSGVHVVPLEPPALQGPVSTADPLTFPTGPHALLLASRPLPGGSGLRRADLLPFAAWSTVDGPTPAFRATLERTARMAVREAALYPDSTAARLRGRPLEVVPAGAPAPREGVNAAWARLLDAYSAFHRLVPADPGPFAFWAVDPQGSLVGVLPDGSGGGSATDDIGAQCEGVSRIAAAAQLSGSGLGLPFAGLVSLQKAISLQALRAAAVIATLEDPKVPPACDKGLGDLACDWAKDTLASAAWSGYGAIDTADDVVEAAGGGGLVNC